MMQFDLLSFSSCGVIAMLQSPHFAFVYQHTTIYSSTYQKVSVY